MKLFLATFAMGVVSSVVPFINMEVYLAGVAPFVDSAAKVWILAVLGGIGQALGKIPWYEASRSLDRIGYVRRTIEKPAFATRYASLERTTRERPFWTWAVMFTSALAAFPPLAVTSVLAGNLRLNRIGFLVCVAVGRGLQFAAILGGVGALTDLMGIG